MKILLVQSYLGSAESPVFPLGLSCLAPTLANHELQVFDPNLSPRPFEDLRKELRDFQPRIVGISVRNIDSTNKRKVVFYYPYLKDAVAAVKETSTAKIVVGGSGFSMFAREILDDLPSIDFGLFLEGEHVFPRLIENLDRPGTVPSVFYREDGTVRFSGPGTPVDLDALPLPDRAIVDSSAYTPFPGSIGVETKRGCALDCLYCVYGFLNGKKLRLRSPALVADEIETLAAEHGIRHFSFVDSVFNIPPDHAEAVCDELIRRRVRVEWSAWFNERDISREFIERVRDAGCRNVIFSPDCFSDESLRRCGKNIRMEDIFRCYEIVRKIDGIEVSYNFFKNPPGQTFKAFLSLMAFVAKARRELGRRVHFEFNSIRIEPHTRLHRLAIEEGIIREDENLLHPRQYSQRETRYIEHLFNGMLWLKGR